MNLNFLSLSLILMSPDVSHYEGPAAVCECYILIIIYYSSLPRVTVMHASDANSKNRFVSHLQIRHMVYTDTGEYLTIYL